MSSTQVILLSNIPTLGKIGDVVKVKRGYARNHLLPTGQAQTYTKEAWESFEKKKQEIIKRQQEHEATLKQLHADLDGYLLQEVMQASEDGQLYGSVTQSVIVDLLHKQNYEIKRNQVILPNNEAIKHVGEHEIKIKITNDLEASMKFSVLSDKSSS